MEDKNVAILAFRGDWGVFFWGGPFVSHCFRVWGGVMTMWSSNYHVESENMETWLKKKKREEEVISLSRHQTVRGALTQAAVWLSVRLVCHSGKCLLVLSKLSQTSAVTIFSLKKVKKKLTSSKTTTVVSQLDGPQRLSFRICPNDPQKVTPERPDRPLMASCGTVRIILMFFWFWPPEGRGTF